MFRSIVAAVSLLVAYGTAQTYTSCNPLNSTCPEDPALGTTFDEIYNSSQVELDAKYWNVTAGAKLISFSNDGMEMALTKSGDSVTAQTSFYIFWGQVEIIMKAASGTGIISTMILLSDDLDEVDWEIKGSVTGNVSTNYYGHGNTSQLFAKYYDCDGPQDNFHNYTINYQKDQVQWILDDKVVRSVPYASSGQYPQTPMMVKMGAWAGGDRAYNGNGTVDWAGGETDWSKGPFVATIKSIKIVDGSTNTSTYAYGDQTGSWDTIKVNKGESKAYKNLNKLDAAERAKKHWDGLSNAAKIGIAGGVLGGFLLFLLIFAVYCVKQRKAGRAERQVADNEWEGQQREMNAYRMQMQKGGFSVSSTPVASHYEMHEGRRF